MHAQLDASLVDLSPSTYDMVVASLPPPRAHEKHASAAEKLARLPGPAAAKAAWQKVHAHADDRDAGDAAGRLVRDAGQRRGRAVAPHARAPAVRAAVAHAR